jgi:tRNA pseudouridine32 synthase/23S rRNA pseudouridine746 synthase
MNDFLAPPLPPRDGINPSVVWLPTGPWLTLMDFLLERFPNVSATIWRNRLNKGEVVSSNKERMASNNHYQAGMCLYYYREIADEENIPFFETVLHETEHLLVVDKPHFLPVMPSGKYLQETVLVRLKNRLGLADLVPIHRIDRDTAGLVLFSVNPATRDAYHALFRKREVNKTYECVAPWDPALLWPVQRTSRIVVAEHFMQQTEVPGKANALTHIAPIEVHGNLARYALKPVTGQRHQLRVHMAALGLPIVNDGIYPALTPEGADYTRPLQLLAHSIAFTDPVTGVQRQFTSQRTLMALTAMVAPHG